MLSKAFNRRHFDDSRFPFLKKYIVFRRVLQDLLCKEQDIECICSFFRCPSPPFCCSQVAFLLFFGHQQRGTGPCEAELSVATDTLPFLDLPHCSYFLLPNPRPSIFLGGGGTKRSGCWTIARPWLILSCAHRRSSARTIS